MLRACELKDQTYKKTRTLHFSEILVGVVMFFSLSPTPPRHHPLADLPEAARNGPKRTQNSMPNMTGRPGYRAMEMKPYLARTPCVPLFSTLFNKGGNKERFRLPGGGSFPLYGGTFARSYSVSKNGPETDPKWIELGILKPRGRFVGLGGRGGCKGKRKPWRR